MWLERKLASRSHYPAVEPLGSVSRVMVDIVNDSHLKAARQITQWLSAYRDAEDLINIGAYVRGSNPLIDQAIEKIEPINMFLRQNMDEECSLEKTVELLLQIIGAAPVEQEKTIQEEPAPAQANQGRALI